MLNIFFRKKTEGNFVSKQGQPDLKCSSLGGPEHQPNKPNLRQRGCILKKEAMYLCLVGFCFRLSPSKDPEFLLSQAHNHTYKQHSPVSSPRRQCPQFLIPQPQFCFQQAGYSCTTSAILLSIHKHLKGTKLEECDVRWGWGGVGVLFQGKAGKPSGIHVVFISVQEGR